jgi:tetratricopeptide (TPR) repeat protein
MGRVVIYSFLFCLVIITVFLSRNRSHDDLILVDPSSIQKELPAEDPGTLPHAIREKPLQTPALAEEGSEPREEMRTNPEIKIGEQDRELAFKAAERLRSGDYEQAIRLFGELSERDKSAFAGLGVSYLKMGDSDRARESLEKALEQDKNDFTARKILAFLYYKKDDLEKSLDHASAGLSLKRDPELLSLYEKLRRDTDARGGFINESTSHFRVHFDGYRHGAISRNIIEILEDAYSSIGKELNYFPSEPLNVILYTDRDFHDVTQTPQWSGGFYDGKIRVPVKGIEGREALLKKVLFHEYTHAVVFFLTPRCPLWVNEGLAEFFSRNHARKLGQIIPLQSLETSFAWLSGSSVGLAYQESYSAVAYLIETHGISRMKEFLLALSVGTDLNEAFKKAFHVSYHQFLREWGKG